MANMLNLYTRHCAYIFINAFSITHSFNMLLIVSKAYPLRKPDKLTATPGCEK